MRLRLNNPMRESAEEIRWFNRDELAIPKWALRDYGEFMNIAVYLPGAQDEYVIGCDEYGETILVWRPARSAARSVA